MRHIAQLGPQPNEVALGERTLPVGPVRRTGQGKSARATMICGSSSSAGLWLVLHLAVLVLPVGDSAAQSGIRANQAVLLRLEGYVGHAPEGTVPEAHLVMQHGKTECEFDLIKMTVLAGSTSYSAVLQEVKPYRVNFVVRGPEPMLARLSQAIAGQKLILSGYYRSGSRDLMLVDVVAAPSATPSPP